MKRTVVYLFVLALFSVAITSCGVSQTAAEKEAIANEIEARVADFNFTFNATYAYPTGFKPMYLSPYYTVKVSPDTIEAFLPYFGRAYRAPMDPSKGGIKFTSTEFRHRITPGNRKGNWKVDIQLFEDGREILLFFDIWENATARLNVNDSNRQPISFQGDIETGKK